jgi:hypothetical protein
VKTAAQWKRFYAEERLRLGDVGLDERLDGAPPAALPAGGALVFPHTMLSKTGDFTAAAALAIVRSGANEVLAIGVLHGGIDADAARVQAARSGDAAAQAALRRVYGAADPFCAEEFSLDNFGVLLARAASREGRPAPRVVARYPFLVGDDPATVPGIDEVARLAERMPVVATADPIHHGAGYGTPQGRRLAGDDDATRVWALGRIDAQLDLLARGDWAAFARLCADVRSDFRDAGPVLAHALGRARGGAGAGEVLDLRLVDYAEVLGAESPTWVAGPLMRV